MTVTLYPTRNGGATASGGGSSVVDTRKLAKWHAGGVAGKHICWFGDSTREQLIGDGLTAVDKGPIGRLGQIYPALRSCLESNHGKNGQTMSGFVAPGDHDQNGSLLYTGIDTVAARKADLYLGTYGLNDFRGGVTPGGAGNPLGGNYPDYRVAYGQPGMVQMALVFQFWMQFVITRLRAQNPNCVIVWVMPNTATPNCAYMANGVQPLHLNNLVRLSYRGDPALGVPSPETFADGVLVVDTLASLFPLQPANSSTLINQPNDGLHPTFPAKINLLMLVGALLEGPATNTLATAEQAAEAAAFERALASGTAIADPEAMKHGTEYKRAYTTTVDSNSVFWDVILGPTNNSVNHAWGGVGDVALGSATPPGLSLGDKVVWASTPTKVDTVKRYPNQNPAGFLLRIYDGDDWSNKGFPSPNGVGDTGVVYRSKYAGSIAARWNDFKLKRGTIEQAQSAFKNAYRITVVATADGSLQYRGVGGEVGAVSGDTGTSHVPTTSDLLCLPGIEGGATSGGADSYMGLPLTGATFALASGVRTITLAGVDFRDAIGTQGFLLSNT